MKGIVLDVKGEDATVLRDDGQFVTMSHRQVSIGEVVAMKKQTINGRILAMVATAAVFFLMVSFGVVAYGTPYYYVSLDVNPSVNMEVNRFDRVIGIESMNDDAEDLLLNMEWKNKDISDVLKDVVQEIDQEGYFSEEAREVLIATSGKNEEKTAELAVRLGEMAVAMEIENAEVSSEAVGFAMVQAAKELGMTPGKYNLITKLLEVNVDKDNAAEYADMSVKELMSQFTADKGIAGKERAEEAKAAATLKAEEATEDIENEDGDAAEDTKDAVENKAEEAKAAAAVKAEAAKASAATKAEEARKKAAATRDEEEVMVEEEEEEDDDAIAEAARNEAERLAEEAKEKAEAEAETAREAAEEKSEGARENAGSPPASAPEVPANENAPSPR